MRRPKEWIRTAGPAGQRYSATEVASALGVRVQSVMRWIRNGWLHAAYSRATNTYRIRHRAVRRLLCDYPSVAATVVKAQRRQWCRYYAAQSPAPSGQGGNQPSCDVRSIPRPGSGDPP